MEGCEIKSFERNADGYLFTAADGTTTQARMVIVAMVPDRFAKKWPHRSGKRNIIAPVYVPTMKGWKE